MFPKRYFGGRMFGQRYFPESSGTTSTTRPDVVFTLPARNNNVTLPARNNNFTLVQR